MANLDNRNQIVGHQVYHPTAPTDAPGPHAGDTAYFYGDVGIAGALSVGSMALPAPAPIALASYYTYPWADYGAPWSPCFFFKDLSGVVHLQGLMAASPAGNASPTQVAFQLPAGYWPRIEILGVLPGYDGVSSGVAGNDLVRWDLDTNGNFIYRNKHYDPAGNNAVGWVSLSHFPPFLAA